MTIVKFEHPAEEELAKRLVLDPAEVAEMLAIEEANAQIVAEVNGKSVTRGDLKDAFDRIRDEDNWKNPIDIRITHPGDDMLAMMKEAVSFFAGCTLHVRPVDDTVHLTAKGYYLSIGA